MRLASDISIFLSFHVESSSDSQPTLARDAYLKNCRSANTAFWMTDKFRNSSRFGAGRGETSPTRRSRNPARATATVDIPRSCLFDTQRKNDLLAGD
jgi:hypothetical protein